MSICSILERTDNVIMGVICSNPSPSSLSLQLTFLILEAHLASSLNCGRRENNNCTISINVCSAERRNNSLRRISKQIRKQDCMISHTDSLVSWAPAGVNNNVRNTWNGNTDIATGCGCRKCNETLTMISWIFKLFKPQHSTCHDTLWE